MNCIIRQNFPIVPYFNHQDLAGPLALMLSRVFVATAETEAIGTPKFPQLSLSGVVIASLSWWSSRARRNWCWCGRRWSPHRRDVGTRCPLFLQFLFVNAREDCCTSDAGWRLQMNAQPEFIIQP